jgi:hypothetical protein
VIDLGLELSAAGFSSFTLCGVSPQATTDTMIDFHGIISCLLPCQKACRQRANGPKENLPAMMHDQPHSS